MKRIIQLRTFLLIGLLIFSAATGAFANRISNDGKFIIAADIVVDCGGWATGGLGETLISTIGEPICGWAVNGDGYELNGGFLCAPLSGNKPTAAHLWYLYE